MTISFSFQRMFELISAMTSNIYMIFAVLFAMAKWVSIWQFKNQAPFSMPAGSQEPIKRCDAMPQRTSHHAPWKDWRLPSSSSMRLVGSTSNLIHWVLMVQKISWKWSNSVESWANQNNWLFKKPSKEMVFTPTQKTFFCPCLQMKTQQFKQEQSTKFSPTQESRDSKGSDW